MNEWIISLPEDQATFFVRVALGFILCLGAIIGSFLNVCIYRIPLEQSVSVPRSHCFSCGKIIPWYHNLPILSWFILRGKCAYCKAPFSFRYAAIEAITALLFLLVFLMWGNPKLLGMNTLPLPEFIPFFWLFVASTVVNCMIDIDHRILLDRISLGGTLLTLVISAVFPILHQETTWSGGLLTSLLGAVAGFGTGFLISFFGRRVFLQDAFGFGDVKWMMLFGAIFGWLGMFYILMLAAFLGLFMGLAVLIIQRRRNDDAEALAIPFGPALGLGAILWLFWSNQVLRALLFLRDKLLTNQTLFLAIFIPVFLFAAGWLCIRIHFIRKAIREEEAAEAALTPIEESDHDR